MKTLFIAVFLLIFTTISAFPQSVNSVKQKGFIVICSEVGYPPFEMADDDGNITGFDADLAAEFARWLGVEAKIKDTEWDSLLPALASGQCDIVMSGMTITTERKKQADFTDPYFASGLALMVSKNKSSMIKSFRDINNPSITVATRSDTNAAELLKTFFGKANLKLLNDDEITALKSITNGTADVFVYDLPFLATMYPQYANKAVLIGDPFTYEPLGAAVKRGSDLSGEFNKFLAAAKKNGIYDRIYKKWMNN